MCQKFAHFENTLDFELRTKNIKWRVIPIGLGSAEVSRRVLHGRGLTYKYPIYRPMIFHERLEAFWN